MTNWKQDEIAHRLTAKWAAIGNDVIKAANLKNKYIVFVRARLLNESWIALTIVYNPKTDGKLREFDQRISVHEFMAAEATKISATVCSAFERLNQGA